MKYQRHLIFFFLLWLMFFQISCFSKILSYANFDQDQEQEIVLENNYYKLIIKPSLGKIVSFVLKSSELDILRDSEGRMERGTLLSDYIVQQGTFGDYTNQPYSVEVLENSDLMATVRLSRRGQTDLLKWITIVKTIKIKSDSPEISVNYEVINEQSSMEDYYLGLGIHNEFDSSEEILFSMPLSNGVLYKTLTPLVKSGTGQSFENITRGWIAISFENYGGIAFSLDYSNLKDFYEWHKLTLRSLAFSFLTKKIEPGKSFKTSFTILPFTSLIQVDGVVKEYAGAIRIESVPVVGKNVPVKVFLSGSNTQPELEIFAISSGGRQQPINVISVDRDKNSCWIFKAEFTPQENGLHVIKAIVQKGKEKLGEFEKPLKVGETDKQYTLNPVAPKFEEDKTSIVKTIPKPAISPAAKKTEISIQEGLPEDIKLSTEIQTPHISWANPYYLGKTKVFFITHTSKEREVIEMAERFSIDFYRVTHGAVSWKVPGEIVSYWTPSLAAQHQKKILEQQPIDTILISAPWNSLEPEIQKLILKRVENGTGLVVISPRIQKNVKYGYDYPFVFSEEDLKKFPEGLSISSSKDFGKWKKTKEHFITTGIPFEMLKSLYSIHNLNIGSEVLAEVDGNPLVVIGQYGSGRVVCLNYNDSNYQFRGMAYLPEIYPFETSYAPYYASFQWWEYIWSMVIKATLWASGREPELLIEKIYSNNTKHILLNIDNQRSTARFNFEVIVRDEFSRVTCKKEISLSVAKGKSQVVIPIEEVSGGGIYFVDIIIKAGNLIVNWGSTTVFLPQENSIKSVKLNKSFYTPSENVNAEIVFEKPWVSNPNYTVYGLLYDSRGYLWEEVPLSVNDGAQSIKCELPLNKIPTMPFYFCVQIRQKQVVFAEKRTRGIVRQKNEWDDYIYGLEIAGGSLNYYQPYWLEEVRKNGFNLLKIDKNAISQGYYVESGLKIADTSRIIDTFLLHQRQEEYQHLKTNYFKTGDLKYLIRPVCFNDPKYREEVRERIKFVVEFMKNYGSMDYLLTDEISITHFGDAFDFCFCEHCLKAFREWVKPQYKNLEELNQSYGTNFTSWEQVRPITLKEAREKGKWAGWADHRRFNEISLVNFIKWIKDEIRKIQPDATISLSGTQPPRAYNGHDVWLRSQVFDNLWAYGAENQIIMHHSFNPSLTQLPWGGYGSKGIQLHHKIWENIFEGGYGNGFWWFPVNLNPDFTMSACSRSWKEAGEDLLKGIGKTISTSKLENYGVAIYYSQSSIHGAYALDASSILEANRNAWVEILKKNQIAPSFISYGQVELGGLKYPEIKVLILPYTVSLSDREAAEIKSFVASGGTVIADMQTGIMDQHCRMHSSGIIDDIFGIKRGDLRVSPVLEEGNWVAHKEWPFTSENLPVQLQEPGIICSTGNPLFKTDNIPGIIFNSYGKGKAWYFNFNFAKWETLVKRNQYRIILDFIKTILDQSGVRPIVTVVGEDGNLLDECQVFVYKNGSALFVGLLPDISFRNGLENKKGRLLIPAGYKIVDMRNGINVNPDQIILKPGIAHFYSLLPYSVKNIQIKTSDAVQQGEPLNISISLDTEKQQPINHVIRFEFYNPQGEEIYWYSKNIVSSKGNVEYQILLPLNAVPGKWSVLVKDLASGLKKIKEFEVKNRNL